MWVPLTLLASSREHIQVSCGGGARVFEQAQAGRATVPYRTVALASK